MNRKTFFYLNGLIKKNTLFDVFVIFCAKYLIFAHLIFLGIIFLVKRIRGFFVLSQIDIVLSGLTAFLAWLLAILIKMLFFTKRPYLSKRTKTLLRKKKSSPAFPSGHTALAFALAVSFFYLNPVLGIISLIVACLIGLARIISGLHWPIDILGGAVLGWLVSFIFFTYLYF